MQSQTALERQSETSSNRPFFVEAEKMLDRLQELSQSIGRRAYEFFEARGGEIGYALEDWLQAESELLLPVPVEVNATDKQFCVRVEVPGFKADEIKVSVEPNRLIISGEAASKTEQKTEQAVNKERRSRQFCRAIELPFEVDPRRSTATLKDGVLELTLDKAHSEPAVIVEVKTK
jgi:HSP20 family molecular chaperone IbpA